MDGHIPTITATRVRLLPASPGGDGGGFNQQGNNRFWPLFVGPVILHSPSHSTGPWTVDVDDDTLMPACPRTASGVADVIRFHEAVGHHCRVGAALAIPTDGRYGPLPHARSRRQRPVDIYGWAIMYQLPGMSGVALVDRHDGAARLPAFYECPLQLLDRSEFLLSRGIRHRPLAVVTRPEDFSVDRFGARFNLLYPASRYRRPCSLSRLLGR